MRGKINDLCESSSAFCKVRKKSGMIRHDEKGSLPLRASEEGVDEARSTAEAWPTLCRSLICGRAF